MNTAPPELTIAPDLEALSEAAAAFWVERAAEAIASRGRFVVALSGGSTPARLCQLLPAAPWRDRVDWTRCHVFWGDERIVPPDDPASNFGMARRALLAHVPVSGEQVHRVPTELGRPDAVAVAYEADLRAFFALPAGEWPRFDLVLLGLGADGHTASLFPGSPALDETRRLAVATAPGQLPPPVERVTLTLPVLNAARAVAFLVAGADKATALRRALAGEPEPPAARVRPFDGTLRWFVDAAAAEGIAHAA